MEGLTPTDRIQERISGVCLIAGPLLMAASTFLEYTEGMLFGAGFLGLLAYSCFIPATLGIARLLRQRAPRLAVVGGLLATLGCVGGVTFSTALLHEWAARAAGTPEAMMRAIIEITEGQLFPLLVLFGLLFPVSLLTLSVGLLRTGVVPAWLALSLGAGALAYPFGHILSNQPITHLAEILLLVPLIWIGLRALSGASPQAAAMPATA